MEHGSDVTKITKIQKIRKPSGSGGDQHLKSKCTLMLEKNFKYVSKNIVKFEKMMKLVIDY